MTASYPNDVRRVLVKAINNLPSPNDLKLVAQRFVDHAVEERLSAQEIEAILQDLGYDSLQSFGRDVGLPDHIIERWMRFGVSWEMSQVFAFFAAQRKRIRDAVDEFETTRHVGLDDFFRDRGLV